MVFYRILRVTRMAYSPSLWLMAIGFLQDPKHG